MVLKNGSEGLSKVRQAKRQSLKHRPKKFTGCRKTGTESRPRVKAIFVLLANYSSDNITPHSFWKL